METSALVVQTIFVTAHSPQTYKYIVNADMSNPYFLSVRDMPGLLCEYAPPQLWLAVQECLDTSTPFVLDVNEGMLYILRLVGMESPARQHARIWGTAAPGQRMIDAAMAEKRQQETAEASQGIEGTIRASVGAMVNIFDKTYVLTDKKG